MSQKATHYGTCQCCGHFQKLPGGRLAKHGYTVQWGFFEGTCLGSHELPYELSCDKIVKDYVPSARHRLAEVQGRIAKLHIPTTSPKVTYRNYLSSRYDSKYVLGEGVLVAEKHPEHDYIEFFVVTEDGSKIKTDGHSGNNPYPVPYGAYKMSALDVINHNRNEEADRLTRSDVVQLNSYIAWQTARIDKWKLTALKPVAEVESAEDSVKARRRAVRDLAQAKQKAKSIFNRAADAFFFGVNMNASPNIRTAPKYIEKARKEYVDSPKVQKLADDLEAAHKAFIAAEAAWLNAVNSTALV